MKKRCIFEFYFTFCKEVETQTVYTKNKNSTQNNIIRPMQVENPKKVQNQLN